MNKNRDHVFFSFLAILISATGFAGFSFTYFGPIIEGSYPKSGIPLHIHGWSFFLWYLLFPIQAILIASKKVNLHMALGKLSFLLVILMAFTGILVLSVRVEEAMRNGAPMVWLLYGPLILSNLILFLCFYSAGIYKAIKKQYLAHKRLIIVASSIGLGAGFFRLVLFVSGFHPMSLPIGVLACSIFIIIGIIYDWLSNGKVHKVYWIGLAVMLVVEISLLPQINENTVTLINKGLAALGEQLGFLYRPDPTVQF